MTPPKPDPRPATAVLFVGRDGSREPAGDGAVEADQRRILLRPPPDVSAALVPEALVRASLGLAHSDEEFLVTQIDGAVFFEFRSPDILSGRAPALTGSGRFLPDAFTAGSADTIRLAERAMRVEILETPLPSTWEREPTGPHGRLAVRFDGSDHGGQPVHYNRPWLAGLGITHPRFEHENGEELPAAETPEGWTIRPPHFSVIYTFDSGNEGWKKWKSQPNSEIWLESSRLQLRIDRKDPGDEIFARPFYQEGIGSRSNFEVSAKWQVTKQGVSQTAIPIFIADGSSATDACTRTCFAVVYSSQNSLLYQYPKYYLRYVDPNGAVLLNEEWSFQYHWAFTFSIQYRSSPDGGTATYTIKDDAGTVHKTLSYRVPQAFALDANGPSLVGTATKGSSGTGLDAIAEAWVDKVTVSLADPQELQVGKLQHARRHAAAVWTGSRLDVLGGHGTAPLREIERFDPVSGVSQVVAYLPQGTYGAASAWTGQHLYLFGGVQAAGYTASILRYDPATLEIRTLSIQLPSPRGFACAAQAAGLIYVFGGWNGGNFDQILRFDPFTEALAVLPAKLPQASSYHACAAASNEVLIAGTTSLFRFNAETESIALAVSYPAWFRMDATAAYDGKNFYAFGGTDGYGAIRTDVMVYHPATQALKLESGRSVRGAAASSAGTFAYIAGGESSGPMTTIMRWDWRVRLEVSQGAGAQYAQAAVDGRYIYTFPCNWPVACLYRYDTTTNTYQNLATPPHDPQGGGTVVIGTRLYLFVWDRIARYDIPTDTWTLLPQKLPTTQLYWSAAAGNGVAFVAAGHRMLVKFDPGTGSVVTLFHNPYGPTQGTTAVWFDGQLYLVGGSSSVLRYNPYTGFQDYPVSLPTNRGNGAAFADPDFIYYLGGRDPAILDEIVRLDPRTRTAVILPFELPISRSEATAAYVEPFGYLFGGWSNFFPSGGARDVQRIMPRPPPNLPPTACFTATPPSGTLATVFSVDARCTTDDRTPLAELTFRWDWEGDGTWDTPFSSSPQATHSYSATGEKRIRLEARDAGDKRGLTVRSVVVNGPPAPCFAVSPSSGSTSTNFAFDAGCTTDDLTPVSGIRVRWDWDNDGVWDTAKSTGKVEWRTFPTSGWKVVRMEAEDGHGEVATTSRSFLVNNPPAVCFTVTPGTGTHVTVFSVDAACTTDDLTSSTAVEFRFDKDSDGLFETGWSPTRTASWSYPTWGLRTVTVEARDEHGAVGRGTRTVTVFNLPPTLTSSFVQPTEGTVYTPFHFQTIFQDPENRNPQAVRVVVGGVSHDLAAPDPSQPTSSGRIYRTAVTLPPGVHSYQFLGTDDYGSMAATGSQTISVQKELYLLEGAEQASAWEASGLWHRTGGSNPWKNAFDGDHSWWYGLDASGNYMTSLPHSGFLTSPPIPLTPGARPLRLAFLSWYETEDQGTAADRKRVEISTDGATWETLETVSGPRDWKRWYPRAIDLSAYEGQTVQIRFVFEANGYKDGTRGWYVDRITIGMDSDYDGLPDHFENTVSWVLKAPAAAGFPVTDLRDTQAVILGLDRFNVYSARAFVTVDHPNWQDLAIDLIPEFSKRCELSYRNPGAGRATLVVDVISHCRYTKADFERHQRWTLVVGDREPNSLHGRLEAFHIEMISQTLRAARDTDGDGLSDGFEVLRYHSSPTSRDIDNDNIPDGLEAAGRHWLEDQPPEFRNLQGLYGDFRRGISFFVSDNSGTYRGLQVWANYSDGRSIEPLLRYDPLIGYWVVVSEPPTSYRILAWDHANNQIDMTLRLDTVSGLVINSVDTVEFLTRAETFGGALVVVGAVAFAPSYGVSSAAVIAGAALVGTAILLRYASVHYDAQGVLRLWESTAAVTTNRALLAQGVVAGQQYVIYSGSGSSGWARIQQEHGTAWPFDHPQSFVEWLRNVSPDDVRFVRDPLGFTEVIVRIPCIQAPLPCFLGFLLVGEALTRVRLFPMEIDWSKLFQVPTVTAEILTKIYLALAEADSAWRWRDAAPRLPIVEDGEDLSCEIPIPVFGGDATKPGAELHLVSTPSASCVVFPAMDEASAFERRGLALAWASVGLYHWASEDTTVASWFWAPPRCRSSIPPVCEMDEWRDVSNGVATIPWLTGATDRLVAESRTKEPCASAQGFHARQALSAATTRAASLPSGFSGYVAAGVELGPLSCSERVPFEFHVINLLVAPQPHHFQGVPV